MSIIQIEPALLFDSNMYIIIGSERTALIDTGTGFQVESTIENIKEVLPAPLYWAIFVFCIAFIVYFVYKFLVIKPLSSRGSCAELVSE